MKVWPVEELSAANCSGDASAATNVCTEDAIDMPPTEPTRRGKKEIKSWYEALFDPFTVQLHLRGNRG